MGHFNSKFGPASHVVLGCKPTRHDAKNYLDVLIACECTSGNCLRGHRVERSWVIVRCSIFLK